ncbi:Argonaute siRNA chaperone complex subunit Arb1-domain-containing protein, partial [Dissophora ornata]
EKKKKKKKKKKSANKPDLEDLLNNAATLEPEDPFDMQSVAERVETAVTRFRKNRKFTPERLKILSTYLDYGGIHTGPKSFQGGAVKSSGLENDDGEPDFDAMNAGIDLVDLPEDGQEVDFTNVATTFLSQHFLNNTGWIEMVYYRDAPLVVAALLNYFLIRNVIPEHEQDLRSALAVAEQAKIELPLCKIISNGWPSRYDKACSLLFGGEWYGFLDSQWQDQQVLVETLGMNRATAEKIVKSLIGQTIEALPSPFDNSDSDRLAAEEDLIPIPLFADVIFAEWDHELPREEQKPMDQRQKIHVYFDPSIATKMLLGMRVTAYVYTLSNGMSYLEQASIFPTYYLEADEIEVPLDEWDD